MERSVRILVMEDNDSHCELIVGELQAGGVRFVHERVRTKAGFIEALETFKPDLVLSDYLLNGWDCMAAFRLVRERGPETPFIIVAGALSEETAVECMKAGITDCVVKEHMARLVPAVRAAAHRRWASELLRETEMQHEKLVNSIKGIVWRADPGTLQFRFVSREAEAILGYPLKDWLEVSGFWKEHLYPDDRQRAADLREQAVQEQKDHEVEYRMIAGDSRVVWLRDTVSVISEGGQVRELIGVMMDITASKQAEETLRQSEARLKELVDSAPDPIVTITSLGFVQSMNPEAEKASGYSREEVIGKHFAKTGVLAPDSLPMAIKEFSLLLSGEERPPFELVFLRKDGQRTVFEAKARLLKKRGKMSGLQVIFRDLTERRRAEAALRLLEEQLRQSQKMEAVGRLAGGIAHDFNNILTAITGYTDLALKSETSGSVHADLEEVRSAAERATALIQQLLSFSRHQPVDAKLIELNELVRNLDKMLRRVIGEDIEMSIRTEKNLKPVKVDPGEIEQVIMNLAVNARDALTSGGRIDISTSFSQIDETFASRHEGGEAGEYDVFIVKDTGCGMSEEVKKHLFEPFFTTKEKGKGTGLGLATCYGIVRQAGGFIDVQSDVGKGTTISVYLPIAQGERRKVEEMEGARP